MPASGVLLFNSGGYMTDPLSLSPTVVSVASPFVIKFLAYPLGIVILTTFFEWLNGNCIHVNALSSVFD